MKKALVKGLESIIENCRCQTREMAAAVGLASLVSEDELSAEYVIPDAFNPNVAKVVADEVVRVARETGITKA